MTENITVENPQRKIDLAKMRKTGAVVLPSLFTIANMAAGFYAPV